MANTRSTLVSTWGLVGVAIGLTLQPLEATQNTPPNDVGILVMAHGGDSTWNQAVEEAVQPLRQRWNTELAFGMADAATLASAVTRLEAAGVRRVAVVRLFLSGDSFRHPTEYLLGLRPDVPPMFPMHHPSDTTPAPLRHDLEIAINEWGMAWDLRISDILALRGAVLSTQPDSESLLLLAHGMGDEKSDNDLLGALRRAASRIGASIPFHTIHVATLREDWAAARTESEELLRNFVGGEVAAGRTVLVVPVRLFGFGPYAGVLEGLQYRADSLGLLPHPGVTEWIERQAEIMVRTNGWDLRVASPH